MYSFYIIDKYVFIYIYIYMYWNYNSMLDIPVSLF